MTRAPLVVVVTGAESTGKSTLAAALAAHFDAPLALEYARAYAERVARPLLARDVPGLAEGQRAAEDAAIARAERVAILDTDLRSTWVYTRHYYGEAAVPPWLPAAVAARVPALYLLAHPDFPWVSDPVRDSAATRATLASAFEASARSSGAPVVDLRGDPLHRLDAARRAVDALLAY
ncbi:MAG: AAA family ATPase [Gemmatimonadetes bacterium]|nr:AAA family ATPase [Gemmatimonadota bacterium]